MRMLFIKGPSTPSDFAQDDETGILLQTQNPDWRGFVIVRCATNYYPCEVAFKSEPSTKLEMA